MNLYLFALMMDKTIKCIPDDTLWLALFVATILVDEKRDWINWKLNCEKQPRVQTQKGSN